VVDTQVVQVCHGGGDGGAQAGDHLQRLGAQATQIPAGHPSQDQPVGRIASLHRHELDHAGMGDDPQQVRLAAEPAALFTGLGPFGN
jgi:hypothetical protein